MVKNKPRGWKMDEIQAVSIVNPRPAARVKGPPELLEQLVMAAENGYWQCPDGHVRACHSLEYAQAKHEHLEEYMPEMCGVDGCTKETHYHLPLSEVTLSE